MTGTAKAGIPMKNTHPARAPSQSAHALPCKIMPHSTYARVLTIGFRIFLDFGLSGEVCLWHPMPFTRLILFLGVGLL